MSIFDRKRTPAIELALPRVLEPMQEAVRGVEHAEIDAALLRAQIGDHCRDADIEPVDAFDAAVHDLDVAAWRRLAVAVAPWREPEVKHAIVLVLRRRGAAAVLTALLALARDHHLLTMDVLRISALRVEELARAWLKALGIAVTGETAAQSAAALDRLDYQRLLAQAEQARKAAEDRLAHLKQAQDADDQARRPRRGKW